MRRDWRIVRFVVRRLIRWSRCSNRRVSAFASVSQHSVDPTLSLSPIARAIQSINVFCVQIHLSSNLCHTTPFLYIAQHINSVEFDQSFHASRDAQRVVLSLCNSIRAQKLTFHRILNSSCPPSPRCPTRRPCCSSTCA